MKDSFVAFFDILGFKNLVDRNSHEDLIEIYEESLYENLNLTDKYFDPIYKIITPLNETNSLHIKTYVISDSIILVQPDLTKRGFVNLIAKCQVLLASSLADGIPLRGALSYGPLSILENSRGTTIVGRGLTKAYSLESLQQWSGGIIDEECFGLFLEEPAESLINNLLSNSKNPLIIKYRIPLKENKFTDGYGFNWPQYNLLNNENDVTSAFTKHKKKISSEKETLMIENTVKYFHHAKSLIQK